MPEPETTTTETTAAETTAAETTTTETTPPRWFEDARFAEARDWMTAKGLTTIEDPVSALEKAIGGHRSAERLLGRGADQLIERPREGQALPDWMRANAQMFGLPEAADKYEVTKPTLPDGVAWDEAFEGKVRDIAFRHGLTPAALNDLVGAYGERVGGLLQDAETQLAAANTEMMAALERDWGAQTGAKIAQARAALQAVATTAKLDDDAVASLATAMKAKVGDAGIVRLFAAIGGMMGEDTLAGAGQGSGGLGATPEEAKRQLALMDAPEGDYGRAYARGDTVTMKALESKRQALIRIASGG